MGKTVVNAIFYSYTVASTLTWAICMEKVRMKTSALTVSMMFLVFTARASIAGFALSIDPADLNFNGAGNYNVDLQIAYANPGANTISGYTIRLGSPADASQGVVPAGTTINSATEGLIVASPGLFNFNNLTNTVAASNLGIPGNTVVPGTATTLFSLNVALGNASSYTFGVDLQNAQRDGLFATQIAEEFYNPNNTMTDFTFTLTNVSAVPEPTSILTAASLGLGGMFYRRKRRPLKA